MNINKTLSAALLCGTVAIAAPAFAQVGGVVGGAGAAVNGAAGSIGGAADGATTIRPQAGTPPIAPSGDAAVSGNVSGAVITPETRPALDAAERGANNAADAAQRGADNAANAANNAANSAANSVNQAANDAANAASSRADGAINNASERGQQTLSNVPNANASANGQANAQAGVSGENIQSGAGASASASGQQIVVGDATLGQATNAGTPAAERAATRKLNQAMAGSGGVMLPASATPSTLSTTNSGFANSAGSSMNNSSSAETPSGSANSSSSSSTNIRPPVVP